MKNEKRYEDMTPQQNREAVKGIVYLATSAVRRMSLDYIRELHGRAILGEFGTGGVVELGPLLKHHITTLLRPDTACETDAIEALIDDLIEAKGLPQRIDLRGQGGVKQIQACIDRLHK